jgi:predicted SprT family Zn-dependent metalloprotease
MTTREDIEKEWRLQRGKWGLSGWKLKLSYQRRHLGYCKPMRKTISVSLLYMERNPFHIMKDTLLHEIAHAIHFIESGKTGHDNGWKEVAQRVGCAPVRCASLQGLVVPEGKYSGVCCSCGKTVQFYRQVRRSYSCSTCSPKRYDPRFRLEITKNSF